MSNNRIDPEAQQRANRYGFVSESSPDWERINTRANEILSNLETNQEWSQLVQQRIQDESLALQRPFLHLTDNELSAERLIGGNTNTAPAQASTISWGSIQNSSSSEVEFVNGSRITGMRRSSSEQRYVDLTDDGIRGVRVIFNGEELQSMTIKKEDGVWQGWQPKQVEPVEVHIRDLKKKLGHTWLHVTFDEGNQVDLRHESLDYHMAYTIEGEITTEQRMELIRTIGEESGGVIGDHRFSYILDAQYLRHVKGASRIFKHNEHTHFSMSLDYMPGRIYCEFTLPQFDQEDSAEVAKRIFELKSWNAFVLYLYSVQAHLDPLALKSEAFMPSHVQKEANEGRSIEDEYIYLTKGRFVDMNEEFIKRYYDEQDLAYERKIVLEEADGSKHSYSLSKRVNEYRVMKNLLWGMTAIEDRAGYAVHMLAISSPLLGRVVMRTGTKKSVRLVLSGKDTFLEDFALVFSEHVKNDRVYVITEDLSRQPVRAIALTTTRHDKRYPLGNEAISEWVSTQKNHLASNEHHTMKSPANPALLF